LSDSSAKQAVAQGTLRERPFPRLLQQLYRKQFTGCCVVADQTGDESEIYLRQGSPVHVGRPVDTDRLDNLLVEYGVVPADIVAAASAQRSGGQRLGDVLERMGALDKEKLAQVLKAQVMRKLTRLFFGTDGTYAIYLTPHAYGEGGDLLLMRVDPRSVIYPGIRAAYDLPRVTQELTRLLGQRFRLTDLSSGFIAALGMAPEDATILSLRKEWKTLDDLDAITARPFEVRSIVLALYYCDLLEREPINQPAADSAIPRSVHLSQSSDVGATFKLPGDSGANSPAASDSGAAAASPRSDAARVAGPGTGSGLASARMARDPSGERPTASPTTTRPSGIFPAVVAAPAAYAPIAVGGGAAASGKPAVTRPAPSVPVVQAPFASVVVRGDAKSPLAPVGKAAVPPRFVSSQTPEALRATILDMAQKIGRVTYFELLGVSQSASSDEVGVAFVRAARQFHPDRLSSAGLLDLQPAAERILARINEAAMILGDVSRRAEYVASLVVGAPTARASLPTVLEAENAFLKGEVFLKKGEHAKAIEAFTAASQGNPSEPQYQAYLAWARYDDPRARKEVLVRETLKTLEGILRERPKFARGFYWVGSLWKFLNEPGKAEHAFREAVALDASFIEASRELRLIDMRKSKPPAKPESPGGGFMGKLFKK
jgi:hypothetical protein